MRRLRSDKRFALDCFLSREPADDAEPDAPSEFWDTRAEADARMRKIIAAGRFKFVELYDGQGAEWELLDILPAPLPGQEPEPEPEPEPEVEEPPAKSAKPSAKKAARKRQAPGKRAALAGKRRTKGKKAVSTRKASARKRKA